MINVTCQSRCREMAQHDMRGRSRMLSDILRVHLASVGSWPTTNLPARRRVRLGVPLISSEPEPLRSFEFPAMVAAIFWLRGPKGVLFYGAGTGGRGHLENNYSQFGFWGYGLGLASFGSCGCVGQ